MCTRGYKCDIRIQLPDVSATHAVLNVDENGAFVLENISEKNTTTLNGCPIDGTTVVEHNNVFLISKRSFRLEYGKLHCVCLQ